MPMPSRTNEDGSGMTPMTLKWRVPKVVEYVPGACMTGTPFSLISCASKATSSVLAMVVKEADPLAENTPPLGVCPSIAFRGWGSNNPVARGIRSPEVARAGDE